MASQTTTHKTHTNPLRKNPRKSIFKGIIPLPPKPSMDPCVLVGRWGGIGMIGEVMGDTNNTPTTTCQQRKTHIQ